MIDLRTVLIPPDSAVSDILTNIGVSASPFTGDEQITELPGARWKLTFSYKSLDSSYGRKFKSLTAKLRGGAEIAHIVDLSYVPWRITEPGTPVIAGADQSGISLATSGWNPSTLVLKEGDQLSYLSTDGLYRMHVVTADVTTDAGGLATVPIMPPMRNPPVNGGAINSVKPAVSVRHSGGGSVQINGVIVDANYEFTEALTANT